LIHQLRTSITGKLFIFICLSLLITILPLFLIVHQALKQFGDYAYTTNARQITNISNASLAAIAMEQAQKYDQVFTRIKNSASLMAQKANDIYGNLDLYSQNPIEVIPLELQESNQIFVTPRSHPIITAYWGGQKVSSNIYKEINALSHLNPYLVKVQEQIPESIASHIITASGIGRYYTRNLDAKNQCFDLPSPKEFDLRNGEPVQMFMGKKILDQGAKWTAPYKDDVIDGFMMTAAAPIVDNFGRFKGIAGIDIPLATIVMDLLQEEVKENPDKDAILFRFLMDKKGRLLGFPETYFDLFDIEIDIKKFKYSRDILNHNLSDTRNPEIKKAAIQIIDSPDSLFRVNIMHENYIFTASTLSETQWHLVLVSREKDLLSSVHKTGAALEKSLSQVSGYYLKYSAVIILIAIIFIFYAVRIIILPIKRLTTLTQKVSEGNLSMVSQINKNRKNESQKNENRKDEIGLLADTFNQMIEKLILSEKKEQAHALSLKKRTEQLKRLNEHLVYSEEIERKTIASDLHDSIAQTLAIGISKIKAMDKSAMGNNSDDLQQIQGFLEQVIRDIRALIYKLSPPILDDFDIDIAIGFLVEETNEQHQTQFIYINNLEDQVDLKDALKLMLYRATGEMLTNILKHGRTKKADIEISATKTHICIRVEDNGIGMDVEKIKEMQGCGFGLYNISERMEHFDGILEIQSRPDQGTKIILKAPILTKERIDGKNQTNHC
jgi:signal transduction histidine kinase